MVMGTASTMACVTEALGLMLPGAATPPAVSGQRLRTGVVTGRRAVTLATGGRSARDILTPAAFANALKVLAAAERLDECGRASARHCPPGSAWTYR